MIPLLTGNTEQKEMEAKGICGSGIIDAVGNAAGDGARIALLSTDKRKEANLLAREVEYLELTTSPDFQNEFVNVMHFPI